MVSPRAELEGAEVRRELVLRPYDLCNGSPSSQRTSGEAKCQTGYLKAREAEGAVRAQVKGFLCDPESVIVELGEALTERGDAGVVEIELARIEKEVRERDEQRAMLFSLFRKGSISESDLERQLGETVEEEKALGAEVERLRGAVKMAGGARESLEGVRGFLSRLAVAIEAEGEVSWDTRRRLIEALVESVSVSSQSDPTDSRGRRRVHTLRLRYNFEDPRPNTGSANGLVLEKELLVAGDLQTLQRDTNASLVRTVLDEAPDLTLDKLGAALETAHGLTLSRASLSRFRAQVGKAPDNLYTRAARSHKVCQVKPG